MTFSEIIWKYNIGDKISNVQYKKFFLPCIDKHLHNGLQRNWKSSLSKFMVKVGSYNVLLIDLSAYTQFDSRGIV